MTRGEAIKIINDAKERLMKDPLWGRYAGTLSRSQLIELLDSHDVLAGQEALMPWVRSEERRPHKDDGDRNDDVLAKDVFGEARVCHYTTVRSFPNSFPWWMPIPPLPGHIADTGKKEDDHEHKGNK